MSCEKIRDSGMCYNAINKFIICKSCFTTCGFQGSNYCGNDNLSDSSRAEECIDKMDCSSFLSHCFRENLIISLRGICDKTCNFCNTSTGIKSTLSPPTTISHLINSHQKDMCLSLRD